MRPKIAAFDFGDETLNFGDAVTVNCVTMSGDLPMNVTWLLNGYPIESDLGITLGSMGKRTHILNIDSATENHAGNYTCFAQNVAGTAEHTATLVINGLIIGFREL